MSGIDSLLPTVDDTALETDELYDVLKALEDCKAFWDDIGTALHIKVGKLEEIKAAHLADPNKCLRATMSEWLKKNYKTEKFGDPSWRLLVKAVGDFNMGVAKRIARDHPAPGGAHPPAASKQATPPASKPAAKHSKVLGEKPTSRDLTLIKWKKGGASHRLRIIDTICNKWDDIGRTLGIPEPKLSTYKAQNNNDPQRCCNSVFNYWFQNPPEEYPLTWSAFIELLQDHEFGTLADDLTEALDNRV